MKKLIVRRLNLCCKTVYADKNVRSDDKESALHQAKYESLNVLEYENGLIGVTDFWTSTRYFANREKLLLWNPCKEESVSMISVKQADFTFTDSPARLLHSIARSIKAFGADGVPEKHKELLAPLLQAIAQLRSELDRLGATSIIVVPDEEASEELRIEEVGSHRYCYSDHIDVEATLANWRQLPDGAGAEAAWKLLVDCGRPKLKGLE